MNIIDMIALCGRLQGGGNHTTSLSIVMDAGCYAPTHELYVPMDPKTYTTWCDRCGCDHGPTGEG